MRPKRPSIYKAVKPMLLPIILLGVGAGVVTVLLQKLFGLDANTSISLGVGLLVGAATGLGIWRNRGTTRS